MAMQTQPPRCRKALLRASLAAAGALGAVALAPQSAFAQPITVDTELFLSIDISGSIDSSEYNLQKNGYVAAFQDTAIQSAILSSVNGVAVGLSEWGTRDSVQEIGWTLLKTQSDLDSFVATLQGLTRNAAEGTSTCISCGLNFGIDSILNNDYVSTNTVLDISGDGTENVTSTTAVNNARNRAVANGITINGLPIGGSSITNYYLANVVSTANGGQNFPATSFNDVAAAARTKILTEVGPSPTQSVPGPLPILGAGTAFGFSRRLRGRIRLAAQAKV
jgi:hypothetical protein